MTALVAAATAVGTTLAAATAAHATTAGAMALGVGR